MTRTRKFGLGAGVLFALTWLLALQGTLLGEVGLTELLNDLPDPVIDVLEIVMQLGARPAIPLVAVVAAVVVGSRPVRVVGVVAVAGLLAWYGAVVTKDLVDRPRPRGVGAEVRVLDDADGSGFPSGHVSLATGTLVAATLVARRRPDLALAVGGTVGLARVAVGVHLPLDVIGGLALGATAAVVVVEVVDAVRPL